MLVALPWDVLHVICLNLPLHSLMSLRRVCHHFHSSLANDKQLWVNLIERDIFSRHLCLHPLRPSLVDASAAQVESWLRCALHLHDALTKNLKPTISRTKVDLHATWLKILSTRWCLVASSSLSESRLTIWDLVDGPIVSKEFFVSGPVVGGLVDDDGSQIVAALTIGTTRMHVLVISIGFSDGSPSLCTLATFSNLSHVRMLRGRFMICAERDGDDTYPTIVNWREQRCRKLVPRWFIDHADLPWGILHCAVCAATQWLGYTILILNKSVEIFRTHDWEHSRELDLVAVASMPIILSKQSRTADPPSTRFDDVEEVLFHDSTPSVTSEGHPILTFSCRTKSGLYSPFSIVFVGPGDTNFSLLEGFLEEDGRDSFPLEANRSTVGVTSNYEVHLRAEGGYKTLPSLFFVNMKRGPFKRDGREAHLVAQSTRKITEGFPLLHYTTTMDFDDGIGLLVLGTAKGYICIVRFIPGWMVAPGSLLDQLPEHGSHLKELSTCLVKMDIPSYYRYYKGPASSPVRDVGVIQEAIESWPVLDNTRDLEPWSMDWDKFEAAYSWAAPANRWPGNDPDYAIRSITICGIRNTLTTFGEVIPLAYRSDPDIVVFRVGPRVYMRSTYVDSDDDMWLRLGALPNSYSDTMLTGNLLEAYRLSDVLTNMNRKKCSYSGVTKLANAVANLWELFNTIDRHLDIFDPILEKVGKDPNQWTSADLALVFDKWLFVDDDDDDDNNNNS